MTLAYANNFFSTSSDNKTNQAASTATDGDLIRNNKAIKRLGPGAFVSRLAISTFKGFLSEFRVAGLCLSEPETLRCVCEGARKETSPISPAEASHRWIDAAGATRRQREPRRCRHPQIRSCEQTSSPIALQVISSSMDRCKYWELIQKVDKRTLKQTRTRKSFTRGGDFACTRIE